MQHTVGRVCAVSVVADGLFQSGQTDMNLTSGYTVLESCVMT